MSNELYTKILSSVNAKKKLYWILLDPDDFSVEEAESIASEAEECGVDGILIGGSLLHKNRIENFTKSVKKSVSIPVILFPGDSTQIAPDADGILFLSLISGRNSNNLIGEQVKGAPVIKQMGIEPISTGYMLIESGSVTSIEFMSNTKPLPANKPALAAAHALAAEYIGMKMIYLEAGSGAKKCVSNSVIAAVKSIVALPVIVGGGIRSSSSAVEKLNAGADIIVTGNMLTDDKGSSVMKEIADTVKNYGSN